MGEGTGARQVRGWNWNTLSLSDPDELSWLAAIRSSDHDGIIILSWTMSLRHQREIIDWLSRFPSLEWDSCGLREDKQCQHIFSTLLLLEVDKHFENVLWYQVFRGGEQGRTFSAYFGSCAIYYLKWTSTGSILYHFTTPVQTTSKIQQNHEILTTSRCWL